MTPNPISRSKHRIVDSWRDVVIVCRCGWRTAAPTRRQADAEYREHREAEQ
jgi:hypothetical protein